jgi:hypothetical protein
MGYGLWTMCVLSIQVIASEHFYVVPRHTQERKDVGWAAVTVTKEPCGSPAGRGAGASLGTEWHGISSPNSSPSERPRTVQPDLPPITALSNTHTHLPKRHFSVRIQPTKSTRLSLYSIRQWVQVSCG